MKAPKSEGKEFEKHPAGWTPLVCTRLIDTGTHWNEGKQKFERKVMVGFESPTLMKEGDYAGQPFLVFANFNYSMFKNAHLCKFVEDWQGRRFESQDEADNFDLSTLLKQGAFANIVHSGQYVNIQSIGPVPANMTAPEVKGEVILIDQDNLDMKMVEKLTDKMKQRVMSANERQGGESKKSEVSSHGNTPTSQTTGATSPESENPGAGMPEKMSPTEIPKGGFDDDIPF